MFLSVTQRGFEEEGENVVRRDRRKRKSGIPTCREDICVMKYPGDTAWLFSSTPGNAGKSKFHEYFHTFGVIFKVSFQTMRFVVQPNFATVQIRLNLCSNVTLPNDSFSSYNDNVHIK